MITFIILSVLFLGTTAYFAYRAYVLAGVLADQEEYYESVSQTNEYMYMQIKQSYEAMQNIDRLGAFEKDDEAGTTFEDNKEHGVFTDDFSSMFLELNVGEYVSLGYNMSNDPIATPTNVTNEGDTINKQQFKLTLMI